MHNSLDEFQFWLDWTTDNIIACSWPSQKVPKSRCNVETCVLVFLGCFTFLRTIQNSLMICSHSGEQLLPFELLVLVRFGLLSGRYWEGAAHSVSHMFLLYFDYFKIKQNSVNFQN